MIEQARRTALIGFFSLLLVIDWSLYFRHAGHFFQGDTIFLLDHRASSVLDYLKEFIALNPSGWFRPLANELFESVLYPIASLHPVPYRIPVYALFIAITAGVYTLSLRLTARPLAAGLATFFFTIHTTNAYTTYDLGFMPELLYALFYISATLTFLRYVRNGSKRSYWLSVICFIAGLLSKESSVTLPGTLFLTAIVFDPGSRPPRARFIHAIRSTVPHGLILAVYLAYAVGHLNVAGVTLSKVFDQSLKPAPGDYAPVINSGIFTDARQASTWAFNIPFGWWGQWQRLTAGSLTYLKFFRALALGLMVVALIRRERKIILFGAAWFWITVLPALPLATHFVPHYLFVSIVGLSLMIGVAFAQAYDAVRSFQPSLAAAGILVIFGGLLYVNSRSIRGDIRDNRILGGSSKLAADTLNDLKRFYPVMPDGMTLYFADADEPLWWEHDMGGLMKMVYGTDKISALYESQGASLLPDTQRVAVFGVRQGRLIDETAYYRSNAGELMRFVNSDLRLALSTVEIIAGKAHCTVRITNVGNTLVRIAYTVDDRPLEVLAMTLNAVGEADWDVSRLTQRGVYRFWAFTVPDLGGWVRTELKLTVP